MKVAFCTTCRNRTEHLSRTLPRNIANNPNVLHVVVDYNDPNGLGEHIRKHHAADLEHGRLAYYRYTGHPVFRMAHAKNLAHRCAMREGAQYLVNVDADNFAPPNFGEWAKDTLSYGNTYGWSRMVKEGEGRLPRGISGRIAVTSEAFVLAGGYDERFVAWSSDDKDFNQRVARLGFVGIEVPGRFLDAILHNDKQRFKDYPEARFAPTGEDHCVSDDGPAVVNGGVFGCGTVWRNFSPEPIVIEPLPTRIFGIGMHKTATTSLHHAFGILGLKSAHWQTAPWAKRVWREVTQQGRSPSLEQFYCACDLPIPLIFRELDSAYPGSKFILTVRDEWAWLKSVAKHWNRDHNPFRDSWDTDVFSHRVHNLLYGRKDFDPTTMLERYRRHNAEVLEHFKNRPNDLLVMDVEKGHGWKELCSFLSLPIPTQAYPHMLKTK